MKVVNLMLSAAFVLSLASCRTTPESQVKEVKEISAKDLKLLSLSEDYWKDKYGFVPTMCFQYVEALNSVLVGNGCNEGEIMTSPIHSLSLKKFAGATQYLTLKSEKGDIIVGYVDLSHSTIHGICDAGWDQSDAAGESLTHLNCSLLVDKKSKKLIKIHIKDGAKAS